MISHVLGTLPKFGKLELLGRISFQFGDKDDGDGRGRCGCTFFKTEGEI